MRYGSWWAVQRHDSPINFGLHGEWRWWLRTNSGVRYGPYLDVHLPWLVLSVGRNPIYAGEVDLLKSYARGGLNGDRH